MREEVKILLKRSMKFEKNATWNIEQGDYDLAIFHIEQALQLMVKAKLLELVGDFPKTHNVITLIELLCKITKDKRIERFIKENKARLARLVDAYISSRYFIREFYKEEALESLNLLREIRDLLGVREIE